eukprot:12398970-Karenia_brevis.AAC.2
MADEDDDADDEDDDAEAVQLVMAAGNHYLTLNVGDIGEGYAKMSWDLRSAWARQAAAVPMSSLKKLFQKVSLRIHPDKNSHPDANSAFVKAHLAPP